MGLENNALLCLGPANPSKITGATSVQNNQVWAIQTNVSSTWTWAWSSPDTNDQGASNTAYTALAVKHHQLQTPQNLLFLADRSTASLSVLPYGYLSPRETPDASRPPRQVKLSNGTGEVTALSALDAYGGLYAASGTKLWWVPVVTPLTADPPSAGNTNSSMVGELRGTVQAMWLMQNSQTLFVAEWFNSSNNIWRYDLRGTRNLTSSPGQVLIRINSTAYPNPPQDHPVVSSVIPHPKTGDIYVGLYGAGGVLIYDTTGTLKGQITTTFVNVFTMEMAEDGSFLYIAGDDGAGSGRLDFLDLGQTGLASRGVTALASGAGGSGVPKALVAFSAMVVALTWFI
ncbi:hypothetical protein SpCBS45565_g06712 [Spizellomyces sp. 'palustris']|nr:hypothetical protein SpCBS45565_g06712 [Spizellomyces sp. 'palustris']